MLSLSTPINSGPAFHGAVHHRHPAHKVMTSDDPRSLALGAKRHRMKVYPLVIVGTLRPLIGGRSVIKGGGEPSNAANNTVREFAPFTCERSARIPGDYVASYGHYVCPRICLDMVSRDESSSMPGDSVANSLCSSWILQRFQIPRLQSPT